ncbi:hypothetical protein O3P69_016817 [Scylla paramamosain]|uniref:Secreted protein n=1 Tax=Scylla paramamosain TaxID=85552 RepID=A0AAW0T2K4_SCYPA
MSAVLLSATLGSLGSATSMTPQCWQTGHGRSLLLRKKKKFEWCPSLLATTSSASPPRLLHYHPSLRLADIHNPRKCLGRA